MRANRLTTFSTIALCAVVASQTLTIFADSSKSKPKPKPVTATDTNLDWQLVWNDEFTGQSLDLKKWKYETGASGWGNHEWQNYTAGKNVEVNNGRLRIIARKTGLGQKVGDYTSTRLNSKFTFTYGRVEVRAKMPDHKGKGVWPAIWSLGNNIKQVGWPRCGELDIMEYVSYLPNTVHNAIHTSANNHRDETQVESGPFKVETAEEKFHVYGVEWTETSLKFYVDRPDNVHLTFQRPKKFDDKNWPFTEPQYLLMNIAVGGDWGGRKGVDDTIFPAAMDVDYVRIFQKK
ncbi:glycoside hydrolase family 16 protein [bacterium]|nr:glycoside hydrolase family 16 protein [bacterium]